MMFYNPQARPRAITDGRSAPAFKALTLHLEGDSFGSIAADMRVIAARLAELPAGATVAEVADAVEALFQVDTFGEGL